LLVGALSLTVAALSFAVILTPFRAPLMAGIGSTELLGAGQRSTHRAAVTLTAVATLAEIENELAPAANALSQKHAFAGTGADCHGLSTGTGQRHPLLSL